MIALTHSKWQEYEICRYMFKLGQIDKLPVVPTEEDLVRLRGVKEHEQVAEFLDPFKRGKPPTWPEKFVNMLFDLRGKGATPESKFAYTVTVSTASNNPATYHKCKWTDNDNAIFRMGLDSYYIDGNTAHLDDFKTGKIKLAGWSDQMKFYAIPMFLEYSYVRLVRARIWYVNHDHIQTIDIHRSMLPEILKVSYERYLQINQEPYPRRPSGFCKSYCRFHTSKGGPCDGSPDPIRKVYYVGPNFGPSEALENDIKSKS